MLDNGRLNEIMRKAPEGFRELAPDEQMTLDQLALKQSYLQEKMARLDQTIRAAEAEIKTAKLEKENVTRAMRDLQMEAAGWNRAHGVQNVQTDRVIKDGVVYIRSNKQTED